VELAHEGGFMVRPKSGWTERGDNYRIVGGKSCIKEDNCYEVILYGIDRIENDYRVPAKDLSIEELIRKLEGPFNENDKGPFGKAFLDKFGKPSDYPRRMPPK
jgi:hypothetical protein